MLARVLSSDNAEHLPRWGSRDALRATLALQGTLLRDRPAYHHWSSIVRVTTTTSRAAAAAASPSSACFTPLEPAPRVNRHRRVPDHPAMNRCLDGAAVRKAGVTPTWRGTPHLPKSDHRITWNPVEGPDVISSIFSAPFIEHFPAVSSTE